MKTFKIIILILGFIVGGFVFGLLQRSCSIVDKAADVAAEQIDPALLLKRYEWFKDVAAQCDKKLADIEVYKTRARNMESDYDGVARKDWDRTDKEQFNLWEQEVAGIIASYNSLAAEYNSAMSKINYRFANIGQLPQGAREPLPREIKEYQYQ